MKRGAQLTNKARVCIPNGQQADSALESQEAAAQLHIINRPVIVWRLRELCEAEDNNAS